MALELNLTNVDRHSVQLEWKKPPGISESLFRLDINKNDCNWVVIYRGFRTCFRVKSLSAGHSYKFRLCVESNDETSPTSNVTVTCCCTTKNDYPSVTAFHHSAYQNLPLLFQEFLDTRPGDVNVHNELGECGLNRACAAGHNDMVLTMLQYGADVNLPSMYTKTTPLMTAAYHGHCEVIRILAHNDADATKKDINSKTALHYAVDGSQNYAVRMLLEGKWSDVNSVDSKGWTPLMRAILLFADLDVINTLINLGSDLSIKDKNGQDVKQLAHLSNNWKAAQILQDNKID